VKRFTDLRSYIGALDDIGDLVRITREVDGDMGTADAATVPSADRAITCRRRLALNDLKH
jgi:3-polyprenyl-4-hydroxybenzoate decarboxylase